MLDSVNPVFVKFNALAKNITVTLDGEEQQGAKILDYFSSDGAKMGYGIGYAGTPQAIAGNITYDGPDVPFADAMGGVKWGRAVLCKATITPASEGTEQEPAKPKTVALKSLDAEHITGTCYGTTIKNCSVQLNAAIAVAGGVSVEAVAADAPGMSESSNSALVIAIMANAGLINHAEQGEDPVWEVAEEDEDGNPLETVVAISEAIDPTVFNAPEGLQFQIPNATGGYTFTVRGTLAKAPFVRRVGNHTSMKDRVSSFPTSQAILDAKIGE